MAAESEFEQEANDEFSLLANLDELESIRKISESDMKALDDEEYEDGDDEDEVIIVEAPRSQKPTNTDDKEIAEGGEGGDGGEKGGRAQQFKVIYETSRSLEKSRIALGNRLSAVKREVDILSPEIEELYKRLMESAERQEADIDAILAKLVKEFPVWDHWLKHVKGIGPSLAAHILGMLRPPLEERGPGTWWKASGMVPELRPDGTMRLPRARAGEGKITYHPWLRRCLWLVGDQFIKNGGYYRGHYDRQYARLFAIHCWEAEKVFQQWQSTGAQSRKRWMLSQFSLNEIISGGRDTGLIGEGNVVVDGKKSRKPKAIITAGWKTQLAGDSGKTLPAAWWARYIAANGVVPQDDSDEHYEFSACEGALDAAILEPKRNRAYYLVGPSDVTWELFRIHAVARWAMIRMFTSHLWAKWLESEGKTSRTPYVIEKLNHDTYYPPPEPGSAGPGKKL